MQGLAASTPRDELLVKAAPNFRDTDYILSHITVWPIVGNIFAAVFCLSCSAVYHLLHVKSTNVSTVLARLDYGGISVLIIGTVYAVIHYSFACDEVFTKRLTWGVGLGIACATCFVLTLIPDCDTAKCRPAKGFMFIACGLSTVGVFVHLGYSNEYQLSYEWYNYAIGGAIYIIGALIYVLRVPERCKPGAFDLCGASH